MVGERDKSGNRYRFGTWNVREMGSDEDAELKIYTILRALGAHRLDLTVITETKHRGVSYEENCNISGTDYKIFFAGPQDDIRNHHSVVLAIRSTCWDEWEASGNINPSVIELSLHKFIMVRKPLWYWGLMLLQR